MSDNIVQHPRAEQLAQKIEQKRIEAAEKKANAEHRKRLKETKSKRARQKAVQKRRVAAESYIGDVIWRVASLKARQTQSLFDKEAFEKSFSAIAETVEAAAEASAAKAAGYKSWAAVKAAECDD